MKNFAYFCLSVAAISVTVFFVLGSYYLIIQVPKYEQVWYQASEGWELISHSIKELTGPMQVMSQDIHELRKISDEVLVSMDDINHSMHIMNRSVEQIPEQLDMLSYDIHEMQRNTDIHPDNVFRRMMP